MATFLGIGNRFCRPTTQTPSI